MRQTLYRQIKKRILNKNLKFFAKEMANSVLVDLNHSSNDNSYRLFRELDVYKKYNDSGYMPPDEVSMKIIETASNELAVFLEHHIDKAIKNKDNELINFYNQLFFCVMGISFYTHCNAVVQTNSIK
jgi:hypothetical protein